MVDLYPNILQLAQTAQGKFDLGRADTLQLLCMCIDGSVILHLILFNSWYDW